MEKLEFIVLGYKPGLNKYSDINLSISSHAIFKSYCISDNQWKYVNTLFYVKSDLTNVMEDYRFLGQETTFLSMFYKYFVEGL